MVLTPQKNARRVSYREQILKEVTRRDRSLSLSNHEQMLVLRALGRVLDGKETRLAMLQKHEREEYRTVWRSKDHRSKLLEENHRQLEELRVVYERLKEDILA